MNKLIVCYCAKVTEEQIVEAIKNGAHTVEAVADVTGAGVGTRCSELNPTGRCCREEIKALIAEYCKSETNSESKSGEDAPPCCGDCCCG